MSKRVKLNVDEITELYKSGMTQNQLSIKYGTSIPTIWKFMKVNNIDRRRTGRRLMYSGEFAIRHLDIELIKQMYDSGKAIKKIAAHFDVDPTNMHNMIKRFHQINKTRRTKFNNLDFISIKKLYDEGLSLKKIAKQIQVAPNTLSKFFISKGIILKNRPRVIISPSDKKKIKQLWDAGCYQKDIAIITGYSYNIIRKTIKEI